MTKPRLTSLPTNFCGFIAQAAVAEDGNRRHSGATFLGHVAVATNASSATSNPPREFARFHHSTPFETVATHHLNETLLLSNPTQNPRQRMHSLRRIVAAQHS